MIHGNKSYMKTIRQHNQTEEKPIIARKVEHFLESAASLSYKKVIAKSRYASDRRINGDELLQKVRETSKLFLLQKAAESRNPFSVWHEITLLTDLYGFSSLSETEWETITAQLSAFPENEEAPSIPRLDNFRPNPQLYRERPLLALQLLRLCGRCVSDDSARLYRWKIEYASQIIENLPPDFQTEETQAAARNISTCFVRLAPELLRKNIALPLTGIGIIGENAIREAARQLKNEQTITDAFLWFLLRSAESAGKESPLHKELWTIFAESHLRYLQVKGTFFYGMYRKSFFSRPFFHPMYWLNGGFDFDLVREHIFTLIETLRSDPQLKPMREKDLNAFSRYLSEDPDAPLRFRNAVAALYKEKYGETDERTQKAYETLEVFRECKTLMEENP